MSTETFDIFIINMNTAEHPIYKGVCISGYGSGFGNTREEVKEDTKRQIESLLNITLSLKIEITHVTINDFKFNTDCSIYGLSSWDSESVCWDSVDIVIE